MLDADAPGGAAICNDLVAQSKHLVPGGGNFIAFFFKCCHRIPYDGFCSRFVEDTIKSTIDGCQIDPGIAVILTKQIHISVSAQINQVSTGRKLG